MKSLAMCSRAILGVTCLLALCGCAAQEPHGSPAETMFGEAEDIEATLATGAAKMGDGEYAQASGFFLAALQSADSYRVMPELLYLLGRSELSAGNRGRAGLSLHLLRTYYPRKWSVLPDRTELSEIADEHAASPAARGHPPIAGLASSEDFVIPRATLREASRSAEHPDPPDVRISNLFYVTDIVEVLADVSAQAGVPIVAATGVHGLVTMEFSDLPLEDCLRRLTVPLGLGFTWMDGYYLVGAPDPRDAASVLLTETLEVRPRHLLAKDALKLLPQAYEQYVRVDAAGGNTLTVTGPPEVLKSFVLDLAAIDRPPRQVMIEALVVEVNRDVWREWGIDWEILGSERGSTFRIAKLVSAATDSSFIGALLSTGVEGLGAVTDIRVALKALEATGGARVKANPRIATLDGQEAKIRVGSEAYYSLLSGSVSYAYYTLQKIATGTTLRITPYIGASSEIITDIAVEVSDVRAAGTNDLPVTSVREVETRARVDNGESIMIGGLLSETERTRENRVPFLGRIPVLGALFGYTSVETEQSEMFVLVTPYIMIHPTELAGLLE